MTPASLTGGRPGAKHLPTRGWPVVLAALAVLLFAAAASCSLGRGLEAAESVTGQIADVQSSAIDSFTSLTIRDKKGTLWTFGEGRFPGFTPSHLLRRQAQQEPLTVRFVEEQDGTLRIVDIEDAGPILP